jgi:hypothetical protein
MQLIENSKAKTKTKLKEETNNSTIVVENFSTPLSFTDRTSVSTIL